MTTTPQFSSYSQLGREEREGGYESLGDLAKELIRMQSTKKDYVVDTRRMTFASDAEGSTLTFDASGDDGESTIDGGTVNAHAHNQIAQRLQIPRKYYDRMRADAPELLDGNVHHWFYNRPETRMVRMLDGDVRAFMSDRYRRLDNYDLMEQAILPALKDVDGLTFHKAHLSPERMVLRAILPSTQTELGFQVGDIVQAGVQIKNSEVGSSSLAIEPYLWKLDCLNGLVSNVGRLRAYHVGRRVEDSEEMLNLYADETLAADDKAFWLKARDAIKAALNEVVFTEIVGQIRQAHNETPPVVSPVAATRQLAQSYNLTDEEGESVLQSLVSNGPAYVSKWAMVNAVTDAAKHADTFDRQEEMERLGGDLLVIPDAEWRVLAAAR